MASLIVIDSRLIVEQNSSFALLVVGSSSGSATSGISTNALYFERWRVSCFRFVWFTLLAIQLLGSKKMKISLAEPDTYKD